MQSELEILSEKLKQAAKMLEELRKMAKVLEEREKEKLKTSKPYNPESIKQPW